MARINIEDKIFKDIRFINFTKDFDDPDKAIGQLVRLWFLAQQYWKKGELIPPEVLEIHELSSSVLKRKLAISTEKGIYVCGSKEQFEWIMKNQENGKKGGLATSHKRKTNNLGVANSSDSNPLSLALSLAPTLEKKGQKKIKKEPDGANDFVARYCELFKNYYGVNPIIGGKEAGIAKRIVKDLGKDKAISLLPHFFNLQGWPAKKRHSLDTWDHVKQDIIIESNGGAEDALLRHQLDQLLHSKPDRTT